MDGLDTQRYPDATIGLTQPVTLSVRRDGASIGAAGSVPVAFADYGIAGPKGYGGFGSLADHGVAEFLLVLHRS